MPLSNLPAASLLTYDAPFVPAPREAFLLCWIRQPGSTALGFIDQGVVKGYGVLRPCRYGFKVGPLFADDAEIAESLFSALVAQVPAGQTVALDTPEVNPLALALARRHGMTAVFETARMYTGPAPALPLDRLYGVTSFELG